MMSLDGNRQASRRPLRVLFLPNWPVASPKPPGYVPRPDFITAAQPFWFFTHMKDDYVVDVLDVGSVRLASLEERYLHFYLRQGIRAGLAAHRYDVVLAFGTQSAVVALAMKRTGLLSNAAFVVDDAGCLNGARPEKRGQFSLVRAALRGADRIVWHASASLEFCTRHCPELVPKGRFFPFGLNASDYDFLERSDLSYVVAVGFAYRDWPTLLSAWSDLTEIPLRLVGAAGRVHRVPQSVEVMPRVSREETLRLVAAARFAVLPLPEGWASWGQMTLLEALCLGKPVVTTDVRPIRDYIGAGCVVVPAESPAKLRDAVRSLWSDPERRGELSRAANAAVGGALSERVMAEQYESLLREFRTP